MRIPTPAFGRWSDPSATIEREPLCEIPHFFRRAAAAVQQHAGLWFHRSPPINVASVRRDAAMAAAVAAGSAFAAVAAAGVEAPTVEAPTVVTPLGRLIA